MATTAIPKQLDDAYIYAKRTAGLANAYTGHGDLYHLRCTGASAVTVTNGSETDDLASSSVLFVIALSAVRSGITITLNDEASPDTVSFSAGDPAGTCKKVTLTGSLDAGANLAVATATGGDEFLLLKDADVDNADPELIYVQSKSETQANPGETPYYEKGLYKGKKKETRVEPGALSFVQHYQAFNKGLATYKGQRFNLLVERDDNRDGTITEQEYYFNCLITNAGPSESLGAESDISFDLQYLWKGVVAG